MADIETIFPRIEAGEEVMPEMTGYRMKCCECGLVHVVDFKIKEIVSEEGGAVFAVDHDDENLRVVLSMTREDEAGSDGDAALRELDTLLSAQGRLMFARERYNDATAETFGVAVLDFMREHGMEVRRRLAKSPRGDAGLGSSNT